MGWSCVLLRAKKVVFKHRRGITYKHTVSFSPVSIQCSFLSRQFEGLLDECWMAIPRVIHPQWQSPYHTPHVECFLHEYIHHSGYLKVPPILLKAQLESFLLNQKWLRGAFYCPYCLYWIHILPSEHYWTVWITFSAHRSSLSITLSLPFF